MIKIQFKKSKIIISVILCFFGIALLTYLFLFSHLIPKAIAVFLIIVIIQILFGRFRLLNLCLKQIPALIIGKEGITNQTNSETKFIAWDEIIDFRTGYYRTNSIYINPKNLEIHKNIKVTNYISLVRYVSSFFTDKPASLWIDIEVVAIKKKELLNLLNKELNDNISKNCDLTI